MSTKTTFKRVALVAVAALGFGVLTSVAPATAATTATALAAGTSAPARVGVVGGVTVITATSSTSAATDAVSVQIASAPAGSSTAVVAFATTTGTGAVTVTPTSTSSTTAGITYGTYTSLTGTSEKFAVTLKADVAGTYQILVTADGGVAGYDATKVSVSYSITTSGIPTSLTVSSLGGAVVDGGTQGQLFGLTMKDANGTATVLGATEGIAISKSDTTIALKANDATTTIASFGATQDVAGTYYVRAMDAGTIADGTSIITFNGIGSLSSSLTVNTTASTVAASAAAGTITAACTTTTNCTGTAPNFNTTGAQSITLSGFTGESTTVTGVHPVLVTTAAGLTYDSSVSLAPTAGVAATSAKFTVPAPSTSATSSILVGGLTVTMTNLAATAASIAVQGTANVLSATGAKNTFTVLVKGTYGAAFPYAPISVAVTGRNTVASISLGVTDANGLLSYSLTDAGTTGTKDTVTFTGAGTTAVATITYGTVTVDSVTVSGGAKAETVAGTTLTAINAADNGPETSYVSIKAVVKDASGNLLAGVPVVFTVSTGAVVKTTAIDYATVYTLSDGSASTRVFNWLPGTQTITATAGGKSSTDYLTWAATDASSARVLSATASGDIVTVKVVDRFGNAIKGVSVDLSRTGTGLFGNGSSTQTVVTDKNGTSDIRFSGTGTVVAELNTTTYPQSADIAGQIAATAVTAASTTTTKGTGASFAPAGVAKVSVAITPEDNSTLAAAQSASDAAAEATDAANAATDAANAAAEAADAATAAAQDAADAVAALSTQVSEMVDALKKQITALTNLVIKIQKKVKA